MEGIISVRGKLIMILIVLEGFIQSAIPSPLGEDNGNRQDTAYLRQQLYNGRVWEKRFDKVTGHEFFLTEALSVASVTIGDRTFNDQLIWYDIFNDRIVLMVRPGMFIEIPGENTGRFSITYMNRDYTFRYFGEMGYCHLLYEGNIMLVRKYVKVIKSITIDNSNDTFEEEQFDYIVNNGSFFRLRNRRDLFEALSDKEDEIRHFIRETGIWLNVKRPELIIPVLKYYDSL